MTRHLLSFRVWLGLAICVGLTGSDAEAVDPGACCVQSTSRLETKLNPNKGSDESFFTAASGPPNIMLILDTSCSMNNWPEPWPTATGCNHPGFAGNGYDPTTDYRGFVNAVSGSNITDPDWFDDAKFYTVNRTNYGHDFSSSGAPQGTNWGTAAAACVAATGVNVGLAYTDCLACLGSAGYYVGTNDKVASGNYLEFYAPKDVSMIMVLSQLLYDVREIRLGIMTFDAWGSNNCWAPNTSSPSGKESCTSDAGIAHCAVIADDPNNCGACGTVCAANEWCNSGVCTALSPCPAGRVLCGGLCVDPNRDPNNCGTCGNVCGGSTNRRCGSSTAGVCTSGHSGCGTGRISCSTPDAGLPQPQCVDPTRDPRNCGSCGNTCAANQYCASGSCTAITPCPSGFSLCNGVCVDRDTDPLNCGSCGNTCAANQECDNGSCEAFDCITPASNGKVCLWTPMGPNCNQLFPFDNSSVESNRANILGSAGLAKNNAFTSSTPLATSLYAAGFHLQSKTPSGFQALMGAGYPGDNGGVHARLDEPNTANQLSICTSCGFNAVIILTDGEPRSEYITSWPTQISSLTTTTNAACPGTTGECGSYLDEVAAFLWQNDIRADKPNKQSVATYTIGFGTSPGANQLLRSTAIAGGGRFYPASGSSAVKDALLNILDDINTRNNSFSSAATVAVQTGSSSTPAILPRMQPKSGQPWEGKLWRFEQYNEFVESTASTAADLNGDGDSEDIFIVDSASPTAANIVTEAADGTFVRNNTTTPAVPFWEANAKLLTDYGAAGALNNRKIWTVVDDAPVGGDGAFTSADTLTPFVLGTATQDLKLAQYMGIIGSDYCPSAGGPGLLLQRFGMSRASAEAAVGFTLPGTPTEADYARLCARIIVRWVQGADFFDIDGDSVYDEIRPSVLGDIFHSSPVLVESPLDPAMCEFGLSNQCVRTLFKATGGATATDMVNESTTLAGPGACINGSKTAYEAYVWDQRRRDKLVLVGANDGMVHAFLSGRYTGETCNGGLPQAAFNRGTGQEMWAFIPPDLLPKLPDVILGHEYMIDGDIMVRDIWADTAAPFGKKSKAEYHTLAVVAEGRGGKHYFGLEVQYNSDGTARDRPGFRWMFPQPCSPEAATFGKTLMALSPKAPPIGPVLIDNDTLPTPIANPVPRYGRNTHERWVVTLSGGWSPGLEKGRGIYMVDAWEGQINGRRDNLWWKFEFDEGASGATDSPKKELTTSVAAPVAMVDLGSDDAPDRDSFFDTAVFGDTSGQLWVTRMFAPGRFSSSGNKFLIDNWPGARAFEMDRDGLPLAASATTLPDGGVEAVDPNAKSIANKSPFFYLPSVATYDGVMRVFAGTGNRYAILEEGAGTCRFDNPVACSKSKCDEVKIVSKHRDGTVTLDKMETHWKSRRFEHGKIEGSVTRNPNDVLTAADMCGAPGTTRVTAENEEYKVGTCDMLSGPDPNPGNVNKISYECGQNPSGTSFTCTLETPPTRNTSNLLNPTEVDTTNLGRNRFVGVWAYGGRQRDGGVRGFSGTTGVTPQAFDSARVTDRSQANPLSGDLIDVTTVGCNGGGGCDGGATDLDYGWFLTYPALSTKTATGGSVIASCVLWSDLSPTGGDGGICGGGVTPLSAIYQANFITGQPNCANSFLSDAGVYSRSQTRTIVAPPPEPSMVVQISKGGEIRYSSMIVEPGKGQATTVNVTGGQDVLQLVNELPVSRSLHNCRHADAGCAVAP